MYPLETPGVPLVRNMSSQDTFIAKYADIFNTNMTLTIHPKQTPLQTKRGSASRPMHMHEGKGS